MTNRQWLLEQMQNMSDEELAGVLKQPCMIKIVTCVDCDAIKNKMGSDIITCDMCVTYWLKAERKEKPELKEAERVILENLSKDFKWIVRDGDLNLYVYTTKPIKSERCPGWDLKIDDVGYEMVEKLYFFNHLFQFIKWSDTEPYNIEELLKGE